MPLQRLRRVLEAQYRVTIESSNELIRKVNRKRARRQADLQAKHNPIPPSKNATVVSALVGRNDWDIRAIDLLHKIGFLTTPGWINMARLSSSWATRRYFWAIAEPGQVQPQHSSFRLSTDARQMDFHQKTLLSDEFGIGMAGLLIDNFFQATSFVDISIALDDQIAFQNIAHQGDAQPDYLMWGDQANSPYYVVECKGSQSDRNTSYGQLRRGLEQVPSIIMGSGPRQIVTIIIATCMLEDTTEVFILDPPPDTSDDDPSEKEAADGPSRQKDKRTWRVRDPEAFYRRTLIAEDSNLLKWAGQYQTASIRDVQLGRVQPEGIGLANVPLEAKRTNFGDFLGTEHLLFPELGVPHLRVFTGVQRTLLESLIREPRGTEAGQRQIGHRPRFDRMAPERLPGNISISAGGSCMIVEGI